MPYDPYNGIPVDLRPTRLDESALFDLPYYIKESARVRHDFHAALQLEDGLLAVQQAFIPAILRPDQPPAERHLHPAPPWESDFAKSYRPGAKTPAGLAGEHVRLTREGKAIAAKVRGNAKLGKLVQGNVDAFFPDIGYSATGGAVRRLRKDGASILKAFHPLGVEDTANIIRLLMKRTLGFYYYW